MAMKLSPAAQAGYQRRLERAAQREVNFQWFLDKVQGGLNLTMRQRMRKAVDHVQDRVVQNISVPVNKEVKKVAGYITRRRAKAYIEGEEGATLRDVKQQTHVVVTERSKPGEFPRADTVRLMRSIFTDVREDTPGDIVGYVGMPLAYGVVLETRLQRQFLTRTLLEEREVVGKILGSPISV